MFSAKIREKSIGKMRSMRLLAGFLVPVIALILGATAAPVWAGEISEAEVFFEFNSTDLDLGFDIFLDADPWVLARVTGPPPGNEVFFLVNTGAGLFDKGNTEIMTESAEPPFGPDCAIEDECTEQEIADAIDDFQDNFFPEGTYTFFVEFIDGTDAETTAELFHDLPAAPDIRKPREGQSLKKAKKIIWRDTSEGGDPEIISYEVVAEMVIDGETFVNTATLPGNAKKLTISSEFRKLAKRAKKRGELEEFKVEVVARGDNLNKTITEVPLFEMEEEEEEEEE
jgi:hypothetical protein